MMSDNQAGPVDNRQSQQSLWVTLPYAAAHITDGFWADYQRINRDVSLVHGYAMLEEAGNLRNLGIAAGLEVGEFAGYWFADSDVYKWLEAVGWELGRAPDEGLLRMAGAAIRLVEQAQQADGYLNSYYQITAPEKRWTDLDHGHELYCAGHLIQAAIAWQRAVGADHLLQVSLKFVDHIEAVLGKNGRLLTGRLLTSRLLTSRLLTAGHPEIEMALVELYRLTGDDRHLELAQQFIDRRGQNKMRGHAGYGAVYQQDHVPVREAVEVAGHAVRQLYLTAGVTDLYMERGEPALLEAMQRLWADMTGSKLYVTGGIGSRFDGEAFGGPYELPSDTCYCETCAAIASLMWNWRLLLITGERRYADLFERTLYNGVLSSPGLEGASYLYVNPLQVRHGRYVRASADNRGSGEAARRPTWHSCACCPPNVMRLFSSLGHYLATMNEAGIQIHQYAATTLRLRLREERVQIAVETDYPWEGEVRLKIEECPAFPWSLWLRVPEWCRQAALYLNGEAITPPLDETGYVRVTRQWQPGDGLRLVLPMTPTFLMPHPRIDAVRGCVALQRGPVIYCFESHDQPEGVDLLDVQVLTEAPVTPTTAALGDGLPALTVAGQVVQADWQGTLYRPLADKPLAEKPLGRSRPVSLTAIPYFAWGNRGMDSMRIWMPMAESGRPGAG